jgi:hypothetical protein
MRFVLASLLILCAVMLTAQTASLPTEPEKPVVEHGKKNTEGNKSQDTKKNNPSPVIGAASVPSQPQPNSKKDEINTPPDDRVHKVDVVALPVDWYYRIYVGLTAVAVFVGGITARFLWRQMRANEIAANAAMVSAQSVMNAERAWILITRVDNPTGLYFADNLSYIPGINYHFRVVGHTPARITGQGFRFHPVPRRSGGGPTDPDLPEVPDYRGRGQSTDIPEGGRIIAPETDFVIADWLENLHLSAEEFEELRQGTTIMCAYGFIAYQDGFERRAETRFCYVYDFAWGGVMTSPEGTVLNPQGFRLGGRPQYNRAT